jgi:hypothetical protein
MKGSTLTNQGSKMGKLGSSLVR